MNFPAPPPVSLCEEFVFHAGRPDMTDKQGFLLGLKRSLEQGALTYEQCAMEIAHFVHYGEKRRSYDESGWCKEYISHVLEVYNGPQLFSDYYVAEYTEEERMLALVHDVVEKRIPGAQKWTLDDFRFLGFNEPFIENLDAISKRQGEGYADYILRGSYFPSVRKVKIYDNLSNSLDSPSDHQELRYMISLPYLIAVDAGAIPLGTHPEVYAERIGRGDIYKQAMIMPPSGWGEFTKK